MYNSTISKVFFSILLILLFLLPANSYSASYTIVSVDKDLLMHSATGEKIKIADLYVPVYYKNNVRGYLEKMLSNEKSLIAGDCINSRYNSLLCASVNRDEDVVGYFIKNGWALNYSVNSYKNKFKDFENIAKKNKIGLWKNLLITSSELEKISEIHRNDFMIVEGVVKQVKRVKSKIYINFGENWKIDFTAYIEDKNLKNFDKEELNSLVGKRVEVRGWIENFNGPAMELYSGGNIKLL